MNKRISPDNLNKLINTLINLFPDTLDLSIGHPRFNIRLSKNLFISVGGHNQYKFPRINFKEENIPKEYQSEVWTINPDRNTKHPAPFPQKLVENCILLTTEENDLVLDPFLGSGTSAIVSKKLNRGYIGIEIDQKYIDLSKELLENKKII